MSKKQSTEDKIVPVRQIAKNTIYDDLFEIVSATISYHLELDKSDVKTMLMFIPVKRPSAPSVIQPLSETPDELIVYGIGSIVLHDIFRALKQVEKREPHRVHAIPKSGIRFCGNTPISNVFEQMAAIPMTVLSFTYPDRQPEDPKYPLPFTFFFIRTRFTVSELLRELARPVAQEGLK